MTTSASGSPPTPTTSGRPHEHHRIPVDVDALRHEITKTYTDVSAGGRLQVADVIIHTEVSEDARKRIDLWSG